MVYGCIRKTRCVCWQKVRFKGQVLKNKYFKDKNFVPGRKVMTCCAEDTQFIGYISFYNDIASLENRQWITVTATVKVEFQMAYKKRDLFFM